MKIALYYNLTSGGAERALYEIVNRLSKKHTIDFYSLKTKFNENLLLDRLSCKNFNTKIKIPHNFVVYILFLYFKLPFIYRKIARRIDKKNYDLVLVAEDFLTKSPCLLKFLKTPTIFFCQSHFREFYDNKKLLQRTFKYKLINFFRLPLKFIDKRNVRTSSLVLAISVYLKKRLKNIYRIKVERITYGVQRLKGKFIERQNFYLSVGSLSVFKGMDFLIKAISLLPKEKQYPLIIVANGGRDEKYIKNLASRLKVNLKIVKGIKSGLDNKKLVGLYNKAKLFLFAPYNEPFGLVVLEAMSCGLPVVGVNEGGLRETIIDGKNGWLCSRNAKKFAETINMALDSVNKKFRIKTAESVKSWSWENSAKQMEKFFKKVVKE